MSCRGRWRAKPDLSVEYMGMGASVPLEEPVRKAGTSRKCADPYRVVYTECIAVLEDELSRLGTRTLDDQQSLHVMRLVRSKYGEILDSMIRPSAWCVPEVLGQSAGHGGEASESDRALAEPTLDHAPTLRLVEEECEPRLPAIQKNIAMRRLSTPVTPGGLEKSLVDFITSVRNSSAATPGMQTLSPDAAQHSHMACMMLPPEVPANSPAPRSDPAAPCGRSIFDETALQNVVT